MGLKQQWQSKTIKKGSLNNDFKNEQKKFTLTEKDTSVITIEFFDKKSLSVDEMMGFATYDLKNHKKDQTMKLKLMNKKKQQLGTVEIGVAFASTK